MPVACGNHLRPSFRLPACLRAGLQLTEHQRQSRGTTRGFHAAGWKPLSVSFVLHQPIGLRRAAFRFSRQTALGFVPWRPRGICHKFATVTVSQSLKANEHLSREECSAHELLDGTGTIFRHRKALRFALKNVMSSVIWQRKVACVCFPWRNEAAELCVKYSRCLGCAKALPSSS